MSISTHPPLLLFALQVLVLNSQLLWQFLSESFRVPFLKYNPASYLKSVLKAAKKAKKDNRGGDKDKG